MKPAPPVSHRYRLLHRELRHCAEEMNHLARFLPALYADKGVH